MKIPLKDAGVEIVVLSDKATLPPAKWR
jgi:hypothetical protein